MNDATQLRETVTVHLMDGSSLVLAKDEIVGVQAQVSHDGLPFRSATAFRVVILARGGGKHVAWEQTMHHSAEIGDMRYWDMFPTMDAIRDKICRELGLQPPPPTRPDDSPLKTTEPTP